jgi:hypothetical protein
MRPLLIVISSNRNYGWVVPAFLKANTQWADYIVVVDQMSTDGSREMYALYENVIVVDDKDMQFKENTRARMAFEKGREIADGRDAIYFALDIDEILPANWMETADGKAILMSKPGDMFGLKWADVRSDKRTYAEEQNWQYKIFHDNGMAWQYKTQELHVAHLPYSTYEIEPTRITDFPNVHFGHYHSKWRKYNGMYYAVLNVHQSRSKSLVSVNRELYPDLWNSLPVCEIKQEWLYSNFDVFALIDLSREPQGVKLIQEIIEEDGINKFVGLDIWDEYLCTKLRIEDPRTLGWKMLHWYLRKTQPRRHAFIVRGIDKVLKMCI